MIDQLSIFLENQPGTLSAACDCLNKAQINMQALYIAENSDYGIVRVLCDRPRSAVEVLREAGYQARLTEVLAVKIPHEPGGLARMLSALDGANINIEYAYCFSVSSDFAVDVLKVGSVEAEKILIDAGFTLAQAQEIYALD